MFHADRLIAALGITPHQYWHEYDIPTIEAKADIMIMSGAISKEVYESIWEKPKIKRKPFEVFRK